MGCHSDFNYYIIDTFKLEFEIVAITPVSYLRSVAWYTKE